MLHSYPKCSGRNFLLVLLLILANAPCLQAQRLTVEEVLEAYVQRMGGYAALQRIQSARLIGEIQRPDGSSNSITVLKKQPDLTRVTVDTGRLQLIQAYNGEVAWFERRIGKKSEFGLMKDRDAGSFIRDAPLTNHLVRHRNMEDLQINLLEDRMLNHTPCYAVEAIFDDGSRSVHLIEKDSFLERRIFEFDDQTGEKTILIPSQFERHGGVDFAMRIIRQNADGERLSTLQLESVDTNVGILDKAFDPPEEFRKAMEENPDSGKPVEQAAANAPNQGMSPEP